MSLVYAAYNGYECAVFNSRLAKKRCLLKWNDANFKTVVLIILENPKIYGVT